MGDDFSQAGQEEQGQEPTEGALPPKKPRPQKKQKVVLRSRSEMEAMLKSMYEVKAGNLAEAIGIADELGVVYLVDRESRETQGILLSMESYDALSKSR